MRAIIGYYVIPSKNFIEHNNDIYVLKTYCNEIILSVSKRSGEYEKKKFKNFFKA